VFKANRALSTKSGADWSPSVYIYPIFRSLTIRIVECEVAAVNVAKVAAVAKIADV